MLTGDRPFPVGSMPEAMHAHIYLDPPKASETVPGVPDLYQGSEIEFWDMIEKWWESGSFEGLQLRPSEPARQH